jgi:site-specific DNA-methyltransferase (adenine-specific)
MEITYHKEIDKWLLKDGDYELWSTEKWVLEEEMQKRGDEVEKDIIYLGDNLDILKKLPDNSIDSVVTDPPYGLGKEPNVAEVMKDWIEKGYHDIKGKGFMGKEWDSFVPQPILWKEVYRVLKPGGYVLSFAGTRTYDWVVMGLRFAGFEIRDMIGWLYGSGFPKSHDVSKAIDKMMGAEREVVGINPNAIGRKDNGGQFEPKVDREISDKPRKFNITAPSSPQAKQYEGWGTALKPSIEPIVMARKPLKGTVAENVLKYGTGGINIDECRVDFVSEEDKKGSLVGFKEGKIQNTNINFNASPLTKAKSVDEITKGRFPANLIHDGSDEVVELFPNVNSNARKNNKDYDKTSKNINIGGGFKNHEYNDEGSASRFFYCAKASQSERNMGLYGFEEKYTASAEFRPNHMEKAKQGENGNPYGRWQPKRNIHPTVKPIDLMRYLVRLVTPKDGLVLDPYMGSGTTAIACKQEKMHYIGCELEEEYLEIAKARIKATVIEYNIFDYIEER